MSPLIALLLLFPAPGPTAAPPEAVALVYAPAEGSVLRRTFESTAEYALDAVDLALDGEPPPMELPEPSLDIEATERIVVVDTVGAVEDGRPSTLERTWEELAWETEFSSDDEGTEDASQTETCDLEGATVTFTWDTEEEAYVIELDEDSDADEDQLEHVVEDMDYRAFLPDDEVEVDDTWELGADAYLAIVWPGGVFQAHPDGEEIDEVQLEMSLALVDDVDCTGEATLLELIEEDGRTVAVIGFELDVAASGDVEVEVEAGTVTLRRELTRRMEGRIRWDVEAGHALGMEGEADSEMRSITREPLVDPEGGEHELEQVQEFSGTVTYAATFEVE